MRAARPGIRAARQGMTVSKPVLRAGGRVAATIVGAVLSALVAAVRFLAGSAQTSAANDELNSSIRGGVLNYRTGKLDDGTDPYGWYERD